MNTSTARARKTGDPQNKAQNKAQVEATPDRVNDALLTFPDEVCALTRREPDTERYLRHRGETKYLFRMGRRLYAWRSDVVAYIEAQRLADQGDV